MIYAIQENAATLGQAIASATETEQNNPYVERQARKPLMQGERQVGFSGSIILAQELGVVALKDVQIVSYRISDVLLTSERQGISWETPTGFTSVSLSRLDRGDYTVIVESSDPKIRVRGSEPGIQSAAMQAAMHALASLGASRIVTYDLVPESVSQI